jgi:hypothetical protein
LLVLDDPAQLDDQGIVGRLLGRRIDVHSGFGQTAAVDSPSGSAQKRVGTAGLVPERIAISGVGFGVMLFGPIEVTHHHPGAAVLVIDLQRSVEVDASFMELSLRCGAARESAITRYVS